MRISKTLLVGKLQQLYKKAFQQSAEHKPVNGLPSQHGITRKDFISSTAMASAAMLLPAFINKSFAAGNKGGKLSVAIIGGGIAGLHACHILSKLNASVDITLYEASKRTGGRIYTAKNLLGDGLTTELGGEFVDSTHEDMLSLIEQYGLEKFDCVKDIEENHLPDHTYFYGGKIRQEQEVIDEFKKILKDVQEDKEKIKDEAACAKLDKLSLAAYLKPKKLTPWFHDLIYWAFTAEFGLDATEINCINFIDMVGLDTNEVFQIFGDSDERFKIKGGNQSLTDAMTLKFASQIKYNFKLTAISKSGNKTGLLFENGKSVVADYVLITVPFSVLRNIKIGTTLHFPPLKMEMIKTMKYGTNSKYLLGFKNRLWRDKGSSGYIMNEEIQNGWDNSQMQHDNKGNGGFTVFVGGKQGRELNDIDLKREKYLNRLDKIFSGTKSDYSGKHAVFNWSAQPYVRGSYACLIPGQWSSFDTEVMMEPVGNIYFAGEHCSEKYQGFMNGGAETGRRAAEAMISSIVERITPPAIEKSKEPITP